MENKKKSPDLARKQLKEDSTTGGSQLTEGQPDPSNRPAENMDYDKVKGIKSTEKTEKSEKKGKPQQQKQKRKGSSDVEGREAAA